MRVTTFKDVPVKNSDRYSKFSPYENVMNLIGKCIAEGGHVEYEHSQFKYTKHEYSHKISAKLFWDAQP